MLRLTKNAQAMLRKELSDYESFLISRAMVYANQEDSIEINDKQISKAIKDYRNSFYYDSIIQSNNNQHRKYRYFTFLAASICLLMYVLLLLLYFKGETAANTVELVSIIGSLTALVLVLTMFSTILKTRETRTAAKNNQKIICFLNLWNEYESLLRNLYKKKNGKYAKTFRDLLNFYLAQECVDALDKETLHRLLHARNNIIHRNLNDINDKTIDGLIKEMDGIIEDLKSIG